MLPFARFAGADAVLGPEMKSHRRGDGDRRRLPDRLRQGAGRGRASRCRAKGTVFITVTDTDKPAATQLAARFHDLGFEVIATSGTAQAISRMGVPVEAINKIGEGSPHVVDCIRSGEVDLVINTPTGPRRPLRRLRDPQRGGPPGDPLHHDDDRRLGGRAGDLRRGARRGRGPSSLQELHGTRAAAARRAEPRRSGRRRPRRRRSHGPARAARLVRGRRRTSSRAATGSSRRSTARAPSPRAGQFYMLAAERGWGGRGGRPYLPRAFSVADAEPDADGVRLDFLVEAVGPGTERLGALEPGERLLDHRAAGAPVLGSARARAGAAGAILVGGGIGIAPLALWRRRARRRAGVAAARRCSASATASTPAAWSCSTAREVAARQRGRPRRPPRLRHRPARGAARGRRRGAAPPSTPAGRRRCSRRCGRMCAERGVAGELAMEAPMACGFGACFGCAVPLAGGGYMRLCVDGPVVARRRDRDRAGRRGRGTDARPERRALRPRARAPGHQRLGDLRRDRRAARLRRRAARALPVLAPSSRRRSRPSRGPATRRRGCARPRPGMINSIGLPNKGLDGFLADGPAAAGRAAGAADRLGDGDEPRGVRARSSRRSRARDEVAALELNVSCPNVKSGLIVGEQPDETAGAARGAAPADREAADREADAERRRPGRGRRGRRGGRRRRGLADQHAARPAAIDPATLRPWLGAGSGGLSGPAVRAVALDQVREVAAAVSIPVIGMGGIETGGRRARVLAAGATAVAVGTASFRDPLAGERVRAELEARARAIAAGSIADLRDRLWRRPRPEVEPNFAEKPLIPLARRGSAVYTRRRRWPRLRRHHRRRPREVPGPADGGPPAGPTTSARGGPS